ncbi:MAG: STAS domain-containing protein [Spirochaetales bacterium]|nr:STAS domain-containing protein [Spirochaetales bacterium]
MDGYFASYREYHLGSSARYYAPTTDGKPATIWVSGDLDTETAADFYDGAVRALGDMLPGSELVLALGDVGYVSSAGVGALARLQAEAEKRFISLAVYGLRPTVRDVFSVLGLLRYFRVLDDAEPA